MGRKRPRQFSYIRTTKKSTEKIDSVGFIRVANKSHIG